MKKRDVLEDHPSSLAKSMQGHHYPALLHRFPVLLRLLQAGMAMTTLRIWQVRRGIGQVLKLSRQPGRAVLDAGCGNGDFLFWLARKQQVTTLLGVDANPQNVAVTQRYAQHKGWAQVTAVEADLTTYVAAPPVDIVLHIGVLQYIREDQQVLANFFESLKPGGHLLLYVPVFDHRLWPRLSQWAFAHSYDAHHAPRRYTPDAVRDKVGRAGFRIAAEHFAYGLAGKVYFELWSVLLRLGQQNVIGALVVLLTAPVWLPLCWVLMALDYFFPPRTGNGLLILAEKPSTSDGG